MSATDRRALWVFAYGSLMWNPGFEHDEARSALLRGWHRRLCAWSYVYRGTPERPGVVLGLDRGGACRGVAYRVPGGRRREALAYLFERELDNGISENAIYLPRRVEVATAAGIVPALAFTVDRANADYAGGAPVEAIVAAVAEGIGRRGTARDYLASTIGRLEAMGFPEPRLRRILELAEARVRPTAPLDAFRIAAGGA